MEKIVNIRVEQIYPHPDNPRKEIGDISELTESIRKNGIMQNLTVIPISALTEEPDTQPSADEISLLSDFHALIGHRRLAAAKEAGLTEVPCKIVSKISKKEQIGIMLEENMQRNDLTIFEQAQGFQMMLDLGETAETIAEKTGFSTTTVYHRLNIAKLNQKELQKKENTDGFQMSLADLYELEKIKDIKTRNKVLKEASNSRDLAARAQTAARDEKRAENTKELLKELRKLGVQPAPAKTNWWDNKWERVKDFDLDKTPKGIKLQGKGPFYYLQNYSTMYILKKTEKKEKKKTEIDLLWEKRENNKKSIKAIVKNMDKRRRQFVLDIISGEIPSIKEEDGIKDKIFEALLENGTGLWKSSLFKFYMQKDSYKCTPEENNETEDWINSLTILNKLLIFLCSEMDDVEPYDYYSRYASEKVKKYSRAQEILKEYGWFNTEEEQQVLDGTHELYEQQSEK